ncbi:MAG: HAD family hydrolase [Gammaproteobacteria bacterium]|nr:HAD family hydrolase [Gammaproteobacteria bacterium]
MQYKSMPYETLIFDLDGTLTNPAIGIVRCMNYALTTLGFPPRFERDITPYIGPPLEIALRGLSGSDDADCIKQLIVAYRERYGEFGYAENTVYEGIYPMLDALLASGVRMGVCTSKYEKYAIKVLQEFNLFDYFEFVSGSDYHVAKSEQLAELLNAGTITSNSLMIGDRAIDLAAAQQNGLTGAGVLWGFGDREELAGGNPVFIAESPLELLQRLQNKPE